MRELVKARLAPFRNRDFRNFFLAQTLSLVGTWSHDLARSWIIVEATGSSGALGNLNLCLAVPCLFLILQGGVLVDRVDVRRLMQWTKSMMGIACLVLATLTAVSQIQVWQLMVFAVVEGIIISFDSPAFQALTVRLVPRADFQQAIALNSTNYHTSRMIGPLVAAWLMAWHGPGLVFFFDGMTYFVVAIVLAGVNLGAARQSKPTLSRRKSLGEGFRYIFGNASLRFRLMQLLLTLGCIYPMMSTVFRVYVQQKFNLGAGEFGAVFSFPAIGSMAGAMTFAILKPRNPMKAMYFGIPIVFAMLMALPWISDLSFTVAAMSLTGFGLYLSFASLTVSMQLEVQEEYRGRLSSVIGMGFSAIGPLMSFPWGHLADSYGAPEMIFCAAAIFGIGSAVLAYANQT
jgi:MFS family permease